MTWFLLFLMALMQLFNFLGADKPIPRNTEPIHQGRSGRHR
jgi:hypothetical protein